MDNKTRNRMKKKKKKKEKEKEEEEEAAREAAKEAKRIAEEEEAARAEEAKRIAEEEEAARAEEAKRIAEEEEAARAEEAKRIAEEEAARAEEAKRIAEEEEAARAEEAKRIAEEEEAARAEEAKRIAEEEEAARAEEAKRIAEEEEAARAEEEQEAASQDKGKGNAASRAAAAIAAAIAEEEQEAAAAEESKDALFKVPEKDAKIIGLVIDITLSMNIPLSISYGLRQSRLEKSARKGGGRQENVGHTCHLEEDDPLMFNNHITLFHHLLAALTSFFKHLQTLKGDDIIIKPRFFGRSIIGLENLLDVKLINAYKILDKLKIFTRYCYPNYLQIRDAGFLPGKELDKDEWITLYTENGGESECINNCIEGGCEEIYFAGDGGIDFDDAEDVEYIERLKIKAKSSNIPINTIGLFVEGRTPERDIDWMKSLSSYTGGYHIHKVHIFT